MAARLTPQPKDDLYVEITYTPTGVYKWYAELKTETENIWRLDSAGSDFKWLIHWYAQRMLTKERKRRAARKRAEEMGKVVVR